MIRAIILDCFGVLTSAPWREFIDNLPIQQKEDCRQLNRALDSGKISLADFLQGVNRITDKPIDLIKDVISSGSGKNTKLLDYLAELKKHYKIGLLSNISSDWIKREFLTEDEAKLFDDMVFSYQIRMVKPDPRAFELTAGRLGEPVSKCIMVDDSKQNCQGAVSVGMEAIHYKTFEQFKIELRKILDQ